MPVHTLPPAPTPAQVDEPAVRDERLVHVCRVDHDCRATSLASCRSYCGLDLSDAHSVEGPLRVLGEEWCVVCNQMYGEDTCAA